MQSPPIAPPNYDDIVQMYQAYEALDAEDPPNIRYGNIKEWTINQHVKHRDNDRPAVMSHNPQAGGHSFNMAWFQNGNRHRDGDKPADIRVLKTVPRILSGPSTCYILIGMMWSKNGTAHRDNDNPSAENYTFENGILIDWKFVWSENGRLHRNGFMPAVMSSGPDGVKEEYWLNGERVPPPTDSQKASLYLGRKLPKALLDWEINSFLDKRKVDQIKAITEQRKANKEAHYKAFYTDPQNEMNRKYRHSQLATATRKKETKAGGRFPKRGKNTSRRMKRIKRKSSLKRKK